MAAAPTRYNTRKIFISIAVLVLIGIGLYFALTGGGGPQDGMQGGAIPVTIKTMAPEKVRVWTDFSGRLDAVDAAEIRPEVSGRITEVRFEDGQNVKKGQILFVIDPRPYEAAVARADANLASARNNAQFAVLEQRRAEQMVKTQAITQRLHDERANAARVAAANVKAADAELKQARINLDHAYVKSPIAGRVSRAEITVGNLVQAGPGAPLLTSVVSNEEIYADFEVDEQTYIKSIRSVASGRDQEQEIPVKLSLQNDSGHEYDGMIDSFDNQIDVGSGTIRARAKFKNTDGALVPGMFVSVSLAGGSSDEALLVPEKALGFDQNKKFVYVVGPENKVAYREVQLGKQVAGQRVVLEGLQAGDKVIVDGVQHVRPEAVVDAKDAAAGAPAPTPAPAPDKTAEADSKNSLVKR